MPIKILPPKPLAAWTEEGTWPHILATIVHYASCNSVHGGGDGGPTPLLDEYISLLNNYASTSAENPGVLSYQIIFHLRNDPAGTV